MDVFASLLEISLIILQLVGPIWGIEIPEKILGVSTEEFFYQESQVTEVVDGDTIKVWLDGQEQTIRLVGIDTPETKHPQKKQECFGQEANQKAQELLAGQIVHLKADSVQPNKDRYDRLLRYVYTDSNISINETLVETGYARVYTKAGSDLMERLLLLESVAQEERLGLWNECP